MQSGKLLILLLFLLGMTIRVFSSFYPLSNEIHDDIKKKISTLTQSPIIRITTNELDDDPIPICFLVSTYGKWLNTVDKVFPVRKLPFYDKPYYNFFGFTNLPRWERPGWTRVVTNMPELRRFITQSRWPKFQAWKHEQIQANCSVVFYMDSITEITGNSEQYQTLARQVLDSEVGFAQYTHPMGGGAFAEFQRIAMSGKDTVHNIEQSKKWLVNQTDFRRNCTLYENRYIAYNVNSSNFQKATDFFWNRYSQEVDSWRDQPLWCYVLDHFKLTPLPLPHDKLFRVMKSRMGKGKHRYGADSDHDVQDRLNWINKQEMEKKNSSYPFHRHHEGLE